MANAVGKTNSMKSAGVTIATLAMISGQGFTLGALATNSEYSLSMDYNTNSEYESTISRTLDGLIGESSHRRNKRLRQKFSSTCISVQMNTVQIHDR